MKKIFTCIPGLFLALQLSAQQVLPITMGMNKVKMEFMLDAGGRPMYSVSYDQEAVIKPSRLGIKILNETGLDSDFMAPKGYWILFSGFLRMA
jgi:hypothetical protein